MFIIILAIREFLLDFSTELIVARVMEMNLVSDMEKLNIQVLTYLFLDVNILVGLEDEV